MITKKKKIRVSALLSATLVQQMKEYSAEQEMSFNALLEEAAETWFEKKLQKDTEELGKMSFEDLPSENDWLLLQQG